MPVALHVYDKPVRGGGIRQVVESATGLLEGRGWTVRRLRLVRPDAETDPPIPGEERLPVRFSSLSAPDAAAATAANAARGADLVHLHLGFTSLSPALVAALAGAAPLLVALHDVTPFCPNGVRLAWPGGRVCERRAGPPCYATLCAGGGSPLGTLRAARVSLARAAVWDALVDGATAFLSPSRFLGDLAIRHGAPEEKIVVLPHAVEWAGAADVPPPSSAPPRLLYAGRLAREKGAALALEAFARLETPGAELVFCGDGPLAGALRDRAARLGVAGSVTFLGWCDRETLRQAIGSARAVLQPSLVPEGFGLSALEAMALGRPLAGLSRGACRDWLVDGVTGRAAATPDPAGLAAAAEPLLADGALADRLGAAARSRALEACAPQRVGDRLAALCTALAAGDWTRTAA